MFFDLYVSRDDNVNEIVRENSMVFRFVDARALVSSHVNGEASENQNRADRKATAGASQDFAA